MELQLEVPGLYSHSRSPWYAVPIWKLPPHQHKLREVWWESVVNIKDTLLPLSLRKLQRCLELCARDQGKKPNLYFLSYLNTIAVSLCKVTA